MEDEQCVSRAEPERAGRVCLRLLTASGPVEPPGQRVFGVDARRGSVRRAGARECAGDVPSVIEVEDGGLELRADAVRGEELLDRTHERVLATSLGIAAG